MYLPAIGILIPFAGTTLGAAFVFLIRHSFCERLQRPMLAFSAGVMLAALVWSLLIPSIEQTQARGGIAWIPAAAGFLMGIACLRAADRFFPEERAKQKGGKSLLFLAITVHNIPEGMAVGVIFAGMLAGTGITPTEAFALSLGIALQNIPEGAVVSLPMGCETGLKGKAFLYGALSGAVEPLAACMTIALTGLLVPVLPWLLSFAAGAMMYVIVEELLPETAGRENSCIGIFSLAFVLMMILDVALG